MSTPTRSSSIKVLLVGEVMVTLPVTIIMLSLFLIGLKFGLGWVFSCIISSGGAWIAWSKLLQKWKNWALKRGVDRERIYRLGKIGLINFHRHRIFDDKTDGGAPVSNV